MSQKAATDSDFEQRFALVEGLLAQLSTSADPEAKLVTREILATVLELHQRGLARMPELAGDQIRPALVRDEHVSAMLLLHGLHPLPLDARVSSAVERLRLSLHDRLEDVMVQTHGGRIALRVVPAANACSSTRAALKHAFEEALLTAVPDAESVSVEIAVPAPALVALRVRPSAGERSPGGRQ